VCQQTQIDDFKVVQKLESGGYGEISAVRLPDSPNLLALKTESLDSFSPTLSTELGFMKLLPRAALP
jgi:hypothetical protein